MPKKSHHILLVVLIILIIGSGVFIYLNKVFLPQNIKKLVIEKTQSALNRNVEIEDIRLNIFKGIVAKNITIYDRSDPAQHFLKADELRIKILFLPFLKNKTVIIPSIKISKPYISIVQNIDQSFNFSDLIKHENSNAKSPLPSIAIKKIIIEDGIVDFVKKSSEENLAQKITNLNLKALLTLKQNIEIDLSASIADEKTDLKAFGQYEIPEHKLNLTVDAQNIKIAKYLKAYPVAGLVFNDGIIPSARFDISWQKNNLNVTANADVSNLDLQINDEQKLSGNIRLSNATFSLQNKIIQLKGTVESPLLHYDLSADRQFQAQVQANITSFSRQSGLLKILGSIKVNNADFKIDDTLVKGNIDLNNADLQIDPQAVQILGNLDLQNGYIQVAEDKSFEGNIKTGETSVIYEDNELTINTVADLKNSKIIYDKNILLNDAVAIPELKISFKDSFMNAAGKINMTSSNLTLASGIQYEGNPSTDFALEYDLKEKLLTQLNGSLNLSNDTISNAPYIKTVNNIQGKISFLGDAINIAPIALSAQNTDFILSGSVKNFNDPMLNLTATTDNLDLAKALEFIPAIKKRFQLDAQGASSIEAKFNGRLRDFAKGSLKISADLKNALIDAKILPSPINNATGKITYEDNLLTWNKLKLTFLNKDLVLNGQLKDFTLPVITTNLSSSDLSLKTEIIILKETIRLPLLTGRYMNSDFNLPCEIFLKADSSPTIHAEGKVDLNLKDIESLLPAERKETFAHLKLEGVLAADVHFKGSLSDWKNWSLSVQGKSDTIQSGDILFQDVDLTYNQRDEKINQLDLRGVLYDGLLNIKSSVDLSDSLMPLAAKINLTNLNLKTFKDMKKLKNNLAGDLSFVMELSGPATDVNKLEGSGGFVVKDGFLWNLKILEGLAGALIIPEFQNTIFTDGRGDFIIKDGKVITDNLVLTSQPIILNGTGSIDFKKNIDFNVYPQFSEIAILQSESMKKGPTALLTQSINVKVSGTLDKPKFNVESVPLKVLKDTTQVIGNILGNIFQK